MHALQVAKLKFSSCHTCFISIPRQWSRQATSPNEEVVVYEISSPQENEVIYACRSGTTTNDNTVEINDRFALHCGLRDGQEVLIRRRHEAIHRAREVKVRPSSSADLALLAGSADMIETALMRSTRVVWRGMMLPIWISPNSPPISVYVESVSPDRSPVLLVLNTKLELLLESIPQGVSAYDGFSAMNPTEARGILSLLGNILWRGSSHRGALESSGSASNSGSPYSVPPEQQAEQSLTWKRGVSFSARVIPRKYLPCTPWAEGSVDGLPLDHPTTVFVSRTLLCGQHVGGDDSLAVTFAATIAKIASPQEKQEKAAASDAKSQSSAAATSKKKGQANLPDCETCFVRVFVVPAAWGTFRLLHGTDFVLVEDTLRLQLGLDYASRVELKSLPEAERPVLVSSIVLHPLGWQASAAQGQVVSSAFLAWCREVSSAAYPLVLSSGGLVRLTCGSSGSRAFLVKLSQQRSDAGDAPNAGTGGGSGDGPKYCFLRDPSNLDIHVGETVKPQLSEKCTIELPVSNISFLNPDLQAPKLEELGGVKELCETGLTFLERLTSAGEQRLAGHALLITGQWGSGKSTLAKSLALRLLQAPPFAHVHVIACSALRGKRVDKIAKSWEGLVSECCFRQPAVLVFDDLDMLSGSIVSPEQEKSPDALYFNKVANVFLSVLTALRETCSRVAVIVTGRSREAFNSRLTAGHGQHVFYTVLAIPPPNVADREEILRCLVKARPHLSGSNFDYGKVARSTEGCYARDLAAILDRAAHSFSCDASETFESTTGMPDSGQGIVLTDEHLDRALEEYRPASLRGLNLSKEQTLHWEDAGGLSDVKRTLQEVFLWPTKYPELFANSPIRPLSGLLLYGAPGTGKTLLAGIVASECAANFISIKGPELLSKYIGASEQAVRNVFQRAQNAKPCIIFFDEFDSIAPRRGHDSTGVTDRVVNQLLTLLDGVETTRGVYVLAATSRPDLIDPALLRPGRLDKCLHCPLPNTEERASILVALSRKVLLADDVDLESVAARTDHFSGADLQALLYTAQLEVVHEVFPEDEHQGNGTSRRLDCSWSSDDSPLFGDAEFFCAPSAQRGPAETSPDQARQLQLEVAALSENLLGEGPRRRQQRRRSRRDSTALALSIHQRHLEQALSKVAASVSVDERKKFDTIYSLFRSGTSLSEVRMAAGKRVTLA